MWNTIRGVLEQTWAQFGALTLRVLPNVLASLLILCLGILAGLVAGWIARRVLTALRVDHRASRLGVSGSLDRLGIGSLVTLLSRLAMWLVVFLSLIPALQSLDPGLASELIRRFLLYLPHLVVAAAIFTLGLLLSRFLSRSALIAAVNHQIGPARLLAALTRGAVLLVTVAVVFEHLGIGRVAVLTGFAILLGGVTLAAAIAVGLGSQDLVRGWLADRAKGSDTPPAEDSIHHW